MTGSQTTTSSTDGSFHFWVDDGDYTSNQRFRYIVTKTGFANLDNEETDDVLVFVSNISATETLTNKTIDANNNTISNLEHGAEVDEPSSGVHGVTGSVVGTTDTQTLSSKTLTTPIIGSFINATHAHQSAAQGGFAGEVQVVSVIDGAVAADTTVMVLDDSIPQNDEGIEFMTLAITPKASGHILVIEAIVHMSNTSTGTYIGALFQDTTVNALAVSAGRSETALQQFGLVLRHVMTAGTTSPTTFKIRAGFTAGGTTTFNGRSGGRDYGGKCASSIVIREYVT